MSNNIVVNDFVCDLTRVLVVFNSKLHEFFDVKEAKAWLRKKSHKSSIVFLLYDNNFLVVPSRSLYSACSSVLEEYIYINDLEPCIVDDTCVRSVA